MPPNQQHQSTEEKTAWMTKPDSKVLHKLISCLKRNSKHHNNSNTVNLFYSHHSNYANVGITDTTARSLSPISIWLILNFCRLLEGNTATSKSTTFSLFTQLLYGAPVTLRNSKPFTVTWSYVNVDRTETVVFLVTYISKLTN